MSGGQVVLLLSLAVPFTAGFLIGQWRFLVVVVAIWLAIAIFLRENNGWHGAGWGDGGILINVTWAIATFVLASFGVSAGKAARKRRESPAA